MKILVTGGAGFIGSHLVDYLVRHEREHVCVFDNFSRGSIENLSSSSSSIRVVVGDILDPDLLRAEMTDVEVVFHLAALSSVFDCERHPEDAVRTNIEGTRQILQAALQAGVRRVVFASSREVYGEPVNLPVPETAPVNPKNGYGASKCAAEEICAQYIAKGFELTVLRLSNVYGIRDRGRVVPLFVEQALRGAPISVYGEDKVLDFVWIANLVEVLDLAGRLPSPGYPVNIGAGKGVSLLALATRVRALTDEKSSIQIKPERAVEVGQYVADVTRAQRVFGLHCPDDPLEYLPHVVDAYRAQRR